MICTKVTDSGIPGTVYISSDSFLPTLGVSITVPVLQDTQKVQIAVMTMLLRTSKGLDLVSN
jgi:hypothetical protein